MNSLPYITLPTKPVGQPITRQQVMALACSTSGLTPLEIETTEAGRLAWYCAARALRVERDGKIHDTRAADAQEVADHETPGSSFSLLG